MSGPGPPRGPRQNLEALAWGFRLCALGARPQLPAVRPQRFPHTPATLHTARAPPHKPDPSPPECTA